MLNVIQENMKRNFVLEQLRVKGITHSQQGVSIDDLSYEELKYELVLSAFREIDTDKDENAWF